MAQRTKFFNMLDLGEDYDFDFDTVPGYVTATEKAEKKRAEDAKAKEAAAQATK